MTLDKKDTRKRILETSAKLFTERGYKETSTRDIASALSIASPSLYYHFKSKSSILVELLKTPMNYVQQEIQNALSQPDEDTTRKIVEALITSIEYYNGIVIIATSQIEEISDEEKKSFLNFETEIFQKVTNSGLSELKIAMAIGAVEAAVKQLNLRSNNSENFIIEFKQIKEELIATALKILSTD